MTGPTRARRSRQPHTWLVFEVVIEVVGFLYARYVGRPWQRRRARRLIKQGRVRSILFDGDEGVLPSRSLDGVAEVWEGRIRLWDADLWIRSVDATAEIGPVDPFKDGKLKPSDGDLAFRPRTSIYTLHTHKGGRVKWTILEFQAQEALTLLGVPSVASQAD